MSYKNKEAKNAYYRKYYANNPEKRKVIAARWYAKNVGKIYTYYEQLKISALTHYGKNNTLQCCAEGCTVVDPDILTIDHIENNGAADRKLKGPSTYRILEREGYPAGFQTLCCNHQWKKEILRRRSLRTR